ncbi:MAG: DUF2892 domain-containing protein [Gammaproteobacteria bacterium]
MLGTTCNIDKTDRINRAVIGVILIVAALLGMGKVFFVIVGLVMLIQGMIGWCSIPYLRSQFKSKNIP